MVKILTFRNKSDTTADQSYLADENDTLSFRMAEDGAISLGNISYRSLKGLFPDPRKDWSNQELADLFRVRQLLSGANIQVEIDRGITDEGDPWFIFCHVSGDVFIHLCRIDGAYVLDSPNVRRPLRGADFNGLIADFTNHALPSTRDGDGDSPRRVIRLQSINKVRLHPSAMLAALIWTLFLASEELVLLAPEETERDDGLLNFDGVFAADPAIVPHHEADSFEAVNTGRLLMKEISDQHLSETPDAQHGHVRDALSLQGMAIQQNVYALGLSTIAIAMGFMSEAVLLDSQNRVLEGIKQIGFSKYGRETEHAAILDPVLNDDGNALLAELTEFLRLDRAPNSDSDEISVDQPEASLLQQKLLSLPEQSMVDKASIAAVKVIPTMVREAPSEVGEDSRPSVMNGDDGIKKLSATEISVSERNQVETLQVNITSLEEFQLGKTIIKSSFDATISDAAFLSDYINMPTSQKMTNYREFDTQAQSFIDFVKAKDSQFGIISTATNEIIIIDHSAFRGSGVDTYSFSWETNDGHIISMIGLKADFQHFDLIA